MSSSISESVVKNAITGISSLLETIKTPEFTKTCETIFYTRDKVVISGVGKSGNIAKKIASTFSSLGIKSIFLNPTDASHGDLGVIGKSDTVILLSKSGESIELEDIIKHSKSLNIPIISFTMNENSLLSNESMISLVLANTPDGFDQLKSAPMSSMTTMLCLGDAIAAEVATRRKITPEDYKKNHPGGKIGFKLTKIRYIMRSAEAEIPIVSPEADLKTVIMEITEKRLGITAVAAANRSLIGVITDGDLRRHMSANNFSEISAENLATKTFKYLLENTFIDEAVEFLTANKITSSFVLNDDKKIVGVVNIHDLLKK